MEPQTSVVEKVRTTPKDFFLHLGIIVALYVSAVSLINLLFGIVDILHPDALSYYYDPYSTAIRWSIASLVIFFPVYIFLGWLFNRELVVNPEKKSVGIRRWLTYFTLFITGLTIVIDLVVLLNSFLGGEISTRFVLKVLAVLVVAAFIFFYYILDLRRGAGSRIFKGFAIGAIVLVLASLIGGFSVMGSPQTQRQIRFDNERESSLQSIQWQIINYWQQKQALPATLADLNDALSGYAVPTDPQTKASYEYAVVSKTSFKLCANFAQPSMKGMNSQSYPVYPELGPENTNWQHEAGKACFTRTIDPDKYPVIRPSKGL
jgi:hypothetical protein